MYPIFQSQLDNPHLGKRPKAEYTRELLRWEEEYTRMQGRILEQYSEFYTTIFLFINGEVGNRNSYSVLVILFNKPTIVSYSQIC